MGLNWWKYFELSCSSYRTPALQCRAEGDKVNLNWTTTTEINNDYFTIEKSKDNSEFVQVAIVDGAGNSSRSLNYSTIDESPFPSLSYYRLKQTDYDGRSTYSQSISVDFKKQKEAFMIYPNPTTEDAILVYYCHQNTESSIRVMDLKGTIIYSARTESLKGVNKYNLDLPVVEAGVYFVFIENDFKVMKKKLVIN